MFSKTFFESTRDFKKLLATEKRTMKSARQRVKHGYTGLKFGSSDPIVTIWWRYTSLLLGVLRRNPYGFLSGLVEKWHEVSRAPLLRLSDRPCLAFTTTKGRLLVKLDGPDLSIIRPIT